MDELIRFRDAFKKLTGDEPFPWQEDLYTVWFSKGTFPLSCNLPTGLGKTSVVAIWLIALANRSEKIPRRLVYVVNRRTVVDQTTEEVLKYRQRIAEQNENDLLKRNLGSLAISTLRGQFADNREWSADPSRPAVIVGTIDMIGSRLLFSGYGVGFKAKPLHAGFLGQDVLLVHDEAHLEPAFQKLIEAIRDEQKKEPAALGENMRLKVMALSATSRGQEDSFGLTNKEKTPPSNLPNPPTEPLHVVWRRLKAKKGIRHHGAKRDEVAKQIGLLARNRKLSKKTILVFVRTIDDVKTVQQVLTDKKEGVASDQVQVLTGTVRGLERDRLAKEDPIFARFLLKIPPDGRTVYLICTSAGEVGIDISADHMVCDLTPLDSMIQRVGRVNRRGDGAAEIDVVCESDPDPKQKDKSLEKARWKTLEILRRLSMCDWVEERHDASPLAIRNLNLSDEERKAAFAPEPEILPTSDILFDAWALTTISPPLVREPLPGRPPVEPFLHGISDWQPPETHVAWREEVWELRREFADARDRREFEAFAADLLEDYPLKPHELLRDSTFRKNTGVRDTLIKLAKEHGSLPIWVQEPDGNVVVMTLGEVPEFSLVSRTVLLPPEVGGLRIAAGRSSGFFDGDEKFQPEHRNLYDVADEWRNAKNQQRRIRVWDDDPQLKEKTRGMRLVRPPVDTRPDADEENSGEATGRRYWHWYTRPRSADDDLSKTFTKPIRWKHHVDDVTQKTEQIVKALNLRTELQQALVLAARFHDLGKKRKVWQRSIGNPNPTDWHAKSGRDPITGKLWKPQDICPDYRHEFGSLVDVESEAEFAALAGDMKDLVLHLIAAHHGRGRPHFPKNQDRDETLDLEPKGQNLSKIAGEVPRRFARLQRKYGRWGLAYLESLLRAADWAASATPSAFVEDNE